MSRPHSALSSAIAVATVAATDFGLEEHFKHVNTFTNANTAYWVSIGVAFLTGVLVLLILEFLFDNAYARCGFLRWFAHWYRRERYLEGWWVDVGIDQRGGVPQIINCSFITVLNENEGLRMGGHTWEAHSRSFHIWSSFYQVAVERTLYFGYEYETVRPDSPRTEGRDTAYFNFGLDGTSFSGHYDGDQYTTIGRRLRSNKRFWGGHYKFPEENLRRQQAEAYMKRFMQENGYDEDTFRQQFISLGKSQRKDWFVRFIKESDAKAKEVDLLVRALNSVSWAQPPNAILDLGPGEGTLTAKALEQLRAEHSRYVGVDSNGVLLEELSSRFLKDLNRAEGPSTVFARQKIEDFVSETKGEFDLILVFHCLYYVTHLDQKLTELFAGRLSEGGRLVSMHTDIGAPGGELVNELIGAFNQAVHRDVVQKIEAAAQAENILLIEKLKGDITVHFPALNSNAWSRVKNSGEGEEVAKTIELISFIIDKGPGEMADKRRWDACVDQVRRHLAHNDSIVKFPLVAHVFERRAGGP